MYVDKVDLKDTYCTWTYKSEIGATGIIADENIAKVSVIE